MVASTIFISFGNVFKLINTASFTSFAFTSLCAVGLLVMRKKFPALPRPVKVSAFNHLHSTSGIIVTDITFTRRDLVRIIMSVRIECDIQVLDK